MFYWITKLSNIDAFCCIAAICCALPIVREILNNTIEDEKH